MRPSLLCLVLAAMLAGPAVVTPVVAGAPLAAFEAAAEAVAAHNRVALGYLRTGNTDLATLEVERLHAAWRALRDRFGADRPDAFAPNHYAAMLAAIDGWLADADAQLARNAPDAAETALAGIRDALSKLRRDSGVTVLADCVLDANAAMAALGALDQPPRDWSQPQTAAAVTAAAARYRDTLRRCDAMAPPEVRTGADFRRLVDGALASLALTAKAVAQRDGELFHRIVIELRAFDNLLAFRFG